MDNSRDTKGQWANGHSGNPHGSPPNSRSLAQRVRDLTGDGQALVDFLLT